MHLHEKFRHVLAMYDPLHARTAEFVQQHRLYMRTFGRIEFIQDGVPGNANALRVLRELADVDEGLPVYLVAGWLGLSHSLASRLLGELQRERPACPLGSAHWDKRIKLFGATATGREVANDFAEEVHVCAQNVLRTFHPIAQGRILGAMRRVAKAIATRS